MRLPACIAVLAAGALLAPGTAAAATKHVTAGMPTPKAGDGWKKDFSDNAFYPSRLTVTQGSTVRFTPAGLHNIAFVPKGRRAPAFAGLDPAHPVGPVLDPAGSPAWFADRPRIVVDPDVFLPRGPKEVDGSQFVGSGIAPEGTAPKPFDVKMTGRPGTYRFVCSVHPGMAARVTVEAKGAKVPSAADDRRAVARQYAAAIRKVRRLARAKAPRAGVVQAGNDSGTIAYFGFRPARTTVKAGQAVTFRMPKDSTEIHNVGFGPPEHLEAVSGRFLAPVGDPDGSLAVVLSGEVMYPSDPPGSWPALDGATHGNGWFNTGALDTDPATPLAASATVRFARAGTYRYVCNIHPTMAGTVTVTS